MLGVTSWDSSTLLLKRRPSRIARRLTPNDPGCRELVAVGRRQVVERGGGRAHPQRPDQRAMDRCELVTTSLGSESAARSAGHPAVLHGDRRPPMERVGWIEVRERDGRDPAPSSGANARTSARAHRLRVSNASGSEPPVPVLDPAGRRASSRRCRRRGRSRPSPTGRPTRGRSTVVDRDQGAARNGRREPGTAPGRCPPRRRSTRAASPVPVTAASDCTRVTRRVSSATDVRSTAKPQSPLRPCFQWSAPPAGNLSTAPCEDP